MFLLPPGGCSPLWCIWRCEASGRTAPCSVCSGSEKSFDLWICRCEKLTGWWNLKHQQQLLLTFRDTGWSSTCNLRFSSYLCVWSVGQKETKLPKLAAAMLVRWLRQQKCHKLCKEQGKNQQTTSRLYTWRFSRDTVAAVALFSFAVVASLRSSFAAFWPLQLVCARTGKLRKPLRQ